MTVKGDAMLDALNRWCRYVDPVECSKITSFLLFTGIPAKVWSENTSTFPAYRIVNDKGWKVSNDVGRKINMLLGPHYKTIIKTWCIKHQVDTADATISDLEMRYL